MRKMFIYIYKNLYKQLGINIYTSHLTYNTNMALIKEYFDLTSKYSNEYGKNTIVLMQVGAFYEVYGLKKESNMEIHGSLIMDFSKICDLNVVDKKVCVGPNAVVMAGFKESFLDRYVKKLQDAGFTCIVFTQDEQAPNTTRSLAGIFSPGTYFSCDSNVITNNSCCIWLQVYKDFMGKNKKNPLDKPFIYIGISIVDIYTGQSYLFEYKELYLHTPTTFDELERIISIYQPSETIMIANLGEKEMEDIINYTNIGGAIHSISLNEETVNQERALRCEKQIYQKELLEKFFTIPDFYLFQDKSIATQSFCYLLDFLFQHNPNLVHKLKEPIFENIGDKLTLANHSLKQLNIIDDKYSGKYSSVLSMLNICTTSMGKRKFAYDFLHPVTNEVYLQQEYDITEHCIQQGTQEYDHMKNNLSGIMDITKMTRQIIVQKITPKTLFHFYHSLQHTLELYSYIQKDAVLMTYLQSKVTSFSNLLVYITELFEFLNQHFEMDKCKDLDSIQRIETNFIKKNINAELDSKLELLTDSEDKLECCRHYFDNLLAKYESGNKVVKGKNKVEKDKNVEYVKIHETEKNNFSLIATDRRCKIIEELITKSLSTKISLSYISFYTKEPKQFDLDTNKNIIQFVKQSSSNKIITSYQISELCKNVSNMKTELMEVISNVYLKIMEGLKPFFQHFDTICEFITAIDIVYTRAHIAEKYGYCKPVIHEDNTKSFVQVEDLRHCLIEQLQKSELYVANDIEIGTNDVNGILLYGTNAVGKTSFIKSLGIAVIMAQSGLYVPASSFVFKPYQSIFTRILGNDNLFKGLSTFAVEMLELRTILRLANKNSLILGDELCSGTESVSAISIFVAGIQQLYKVESSFLFATHLHEIVKYEEIVSLQRLSLKHMSVFYDKEKDMLVYDRKLRDGSGDSMYGLEVCKSLHLPIEFLELANNIRMKYNPESASILDTKKSRYNAEHLKCTVCEGCGLEISSEVHHLQHQREANADNNIISKKGLSTFHKNHSANLMNLCVKCHDKIHESGKQHKKTKTSKGMILSEV